tara:strand:- start:2765 stop:3166 length:402 start_codon:yes stop_codon:yes gene_type:complete
MSSNIIFYYDGECPFCNKFAELIEFKCNIPNLEIKNAREDLPKLTSLYKKGYDLNNGAILIKGDKVLHGSEAINWVCGQIKNPSDSLLEVIRVLFSSNQRTKIIFPLLVWSRRFILLLKGVKLQPVEENIQFF